MPYFLLFEQNASKASFMSIHSLDILDDKSYVLSTFTWRFYQCLKLSPKPASENTYEILYIPLFALKLWGPNLWVLTCIEEDFREGFYLHVSSHRFFSAQSMVRWSEPQGMGWKVDLVVAKATAGEAWGWERIITGIFWCSLWCTWTEPQIGILKKFSLYFTFP